MKTYEIKRGHGYYPGKQAESDTIGAIDTGMQFQHTLVGVEEENYNTDRKNILLIKNATKQGYLEAEEGDGIDISSRMEYHRGTVQKGKVQTINCQGGYGVVINEPKVLGGIGEKKSNNGTQFYLQDRVYDNEIAAATTTKEHLQPNYVDNQLRIRKLTPRECFRLQGVKDEDSDKLKGISDMNLYHLAGDSIIVDVLMAIFRKML